MKTRYINVNTDILGGQPIAGRQTGDRAKLFLKDIIANGTEDTLFVLSFQEVFFDHYFGQAFGDFYKAVHWTNQSDVLWKVKHNDQINELLTGIVDVRDSSLEGLVRANTNNTQLYSRELHGDIVSYFEDKNLSTKFLLNSEIIYISKLSTVESSVLDFFKKNMMVTFDQLRDENIADNPQSLWQALYTLVQKKLVYLNPENNYISIKSCLNE